MEIISTMYVIYIVCMSVSMSTQYNSIPLSSFCKEVEIGASQNLFFQYSAAYYLNNAAFYVVKDETTIAKCSLIFCENYSQRHYEAEIRVNKSILEIQVSIFKTNTFKDDRIRLGNHWYILHNDNIIDRCTVQLIASKTNVICQHNVTYDILNIICWSLQVTSKGTCMFLIPENLFMNNKVNMIIRDISLNNTYQYGPYCYLNIPLNESNPGVYKLVVLIYNAVNDNATLQLGRNKTIDINLDYPSVMLRDCPAVIEEHTLVTCYCVRSDASLINATVAWFYTGTSQSVVNTSSNVLHFIASRRHANKGLYCKATNNLFWENHNSTIFYSPAIVGKVQGVSCQTELITDTFYKVTCGTKHVFPEAICKIIIQNNTINQTHLNDVVVYDHQKITGNLTYFKTTCLFTIPITNFRMGINKILVSMYPNVTENGIQFGSNHSLSIVIKPSDLNEKSNSVNPASGAVMIASFVGVNVSICLIVLCVWYYKRHDSKNVLEMCLVCTEKKTEYDEINDGYVLPVNTIYEGDEQFDDGEYMTIDPIIELHCYKHEVNVEHHEYDIIDDVIRIEIHIDQQVEEDNTSMGNISEDKTKDITVVTSSEDVTFDNTRCNEKEE